MMMQWIKRFLWLMVIGLSVGVVYHVTSYGWNERYNHPEIIAKERDNQSLLTRQGLKTLTINELRFAYYEKGRGKKKPLVLVVHGFSDSLRHYQSVVDELAKKGYWVVAYSQRGSRPTDIPSTADYSPQTLGKDMLSFISALGADRAFVIGHEFGAMAAYSAAMEAPEKLLGVVSISAPHPATLDSPLEWWLESSHLWKLPLGFFSEWMVKHNNFLLLDEMLSDWSPSWENSEKHLALVKEDYSKAGRLQAALGYYQSLLFEPDHWAELNKDISVPTLNIVGTEDAPFHIEQFRESESYFSGEYQRVEVDRAGHFVHFEQPETFYAATFAFLKKNKNRKVVKTDKAKLSKSLATKNP